MNLKIAENFEVSLVKSFPTYESAYEALLKNSLKELVKTPQIKPETTQFQGKCIVEVLILRDISKPLESNENSRRCLLMQVTDGFNQFKLLEYTPFEATSISVGSKLLLVGPFEVKRKVCLLQSHNLIVLSSNS